MIWALDLDDFKGVIGGGINYPLLTAIYKQLEGDVPTLYVITLFLLAAGYFITNVSTCHFLDLWNIT